jgi:hypothetical protein
MLVHLSCAYFAAFVVLALAFFLQSLIVQPVQVLLFPDADFALAKIISIPFGASLLIVLMMGYKGVLVVILGKSLLEFTFISVSLLSALIHALHDGVGLLLGLMAAAYMLRRDLKQGLLMQSVYASTLVRQALFVTIVASLIDGVLHASVNLGTGDATLSIRYLMSHILGGLFIFVSLYFLRFRLSRWITVKDA